MTIFNNYAEKKEMKVCNQEMKIVEACIYLEKVTSTKDEMIVELHIRLLSKWNTFTKHAEVFKKNLPSSLKEEFLINVFFL